MPCPDKEVLQDLVDGDLSKDKMSEVIEHVKSCSDCKKEVRQMLKLCKALGQVVSEDLCPSIEILEGYARNPLVVKEADKIKTHIEFCERCQSYAQLFGASPAELAQWEAKEQLEFHKFEAQRIGRDVARLTLEKLLPDKGELFTKVWESVLVLIEDLKDKVEAQWPVFNSPVELAGALGFSSTVDPESMSAAIILSTSLTTAYQLVEGKIKAEPEAIAKKVHQTAVQFGAGKELQKRLSETIPKQIMKSL